MLTPGDVMQLEAARMTALAAMHACRGVVHSIDAVLVRHDEPNAPDAGATDGNPWDTFDTGTDTTQGATT